MPCARREYVPTGTLEIVKCPASLVWVPRRVPSMTTLANGTPAPSLSMTVPAITPTGGAGEAPGAAEPGGELRTSRARVRPGAVRIDRMRRDPRPGERMSTRRGDARGP